MDNLLQVGVTGLWLWPSDLTSSRLPTLAPPPNQDLSAADRWRRDLRYYDLAAAGLIVCVFLVLAWLGHSVPLIGFTSQPVPWPALGFGVATVLRWGPRAAWPLAVAMALWLLPAPVPWAAKLVTLASLVSVPVVLQDTLRRLGFHSQLDRRHDLFLYLTVGAGAASFAMASLLALGLLVIGTPFAEVKPAWFGQAASMIVGTGLVGPLVLSAKPTVVIGPGALRHIGWGALLAALPATLLGLLGPHHYGQAWQLLMCALGPMLLSIIVIRLGLFAATLSALPLAAVAIALTWQDHAPWILVGPNNPITGMWMYLGLCVVGTLGTATVTAELRAEVERWSLALERSNIGIADWAMDTDRLYMSARLQQLLGFQEDELRDEISEWRTRIHPDDAPRVERAVTDHLNGRTPALHLEHRLRCKDGTWKWFELQGRVVHWWGPGRAHRFIGCVMDITERRLVADRLRLSATLFEHLHEGLLVTDVDHRVLEVNRAYERMSGRDRSEFAGEIPELLQPELQTHEMLEELWRSMRVHGTWRGEASARRADGVVYPVQATLSVVRDEAGLITHHVLVMSDITQARLAREQLEFQAHSDALTRLPNRIRLLQLMRKAMATADRDGRHVLAVCYLDMDHFKPINDRFGHSVGDSVLVEMAERLRASLRGGDVAARIGGDEFALLLRGRTRDECAAALERVLAIVTEPYSLDLHGEWTLTASIGVTIYPADNANPDTLLRHADHAMYGAKQEGRNRIHFFDAETDRQSSLRREALKRLEAAINNGELVLHYQPKIHLRSGTTTGVEALVRWQHPQRGLLPPGEFIPLSEAPELMVHLGDWVLRQAVLQLAQWRRAGLGLSVSVNVAGPHLQHPAFVTRLAAMLEEAGLDDAQGLEIEVLETAAFEDVERTAGLMERCRALGARFALDDFGTGYSTLTYLKRLPVDVLKIDRSFVRDMLSDAQDLAIVEGVIGLSKTFACDVVAEGVESLDHAERLMALGCEMGQGYGLASPMPAQDIPQWLRNHPARPLAPAAPVQAPLALATPASPTRH